MNDSSETQTFSNREWRIIGVTSVGHGLCHVSELSFAAVIGAVMAEYGLTPDQAAALAVPGFVLYGVLAIPAGLWTDRRGAREVLRGYFALVTLAALVVCFAQTAWHLAAALTLLGAAISLYHPAGLTMVAQGCRRRGRAMGLNGVAGSLGVALGPALGLFFASRGNWRATYGVIALCGGIGALTTRWLPADDDPHPSLGHAVAAENGQAGPRWRVLGLLFAAMLLGGINYRALTTALPTFLSDQANAAAPVEANPTPAPTGQKTRTRSGGTVVFVVLALGGVGQLVGGHLADRFRPQSVYVIAILLTVPCALVMAHAAPFSVSLAAGILAIFMFAEQPLENIMIAEATPPRWRSTVYGFKFILTFGLASSGAYLTGWIWKQRGLATVFDVFAAIAVAMLAIAGTFAILTRQPRRSELTP